MHTFETDADAPRLDNTYSGNARDFSGTFCSLYASQRLCGSHTKFIGITKILGKPNKLDKLVLWMVETDLMRRGLACNPTRSRFRAAS
jgi:hypothetical protein